MALSLKQVVRLYDKMARKYDGRTFLRWFGLHGMFRKLVYSNFNLRKGATVLVMGCGTGVDFPYLLKKIGNSGKIIGVDISRNMLKIAQKKIKKNKWLNIKLIHADAAKFILPYKIDCVIFVLSIATIPMYKHALLNSYKMLKSKGKLVIGDLRLIKNIWVDNLLINISKRFGQNWNRKPWLDMQKLAFKRFKMKKAFFSIFYVAVGEKR